jgi:sulfonate transport system permease protein
MDASPSPPDRHDQEIAGLDALDARRVERTGRAARLGAVLWPKLAAVFLALSVWQILVWSRWRPDYVLPGPGTVLGELLRVLGTARFWQALATTMRRGLAGFGLAVVLGTALGMGVSQSSMLRRAFGSLLSGLQNMPSIVWFPFAIVLFQLSESAILFVVVLGAAPSVANGLVGGIDQIPRILLRAGRVLGARGAAAYLHVVLPAALPAYVGGLKQGWAFSWRSLMAGELMVVIAARASLGTELHYAQDLSDMPALVAYMIVVLIIGVAVDGLCFRSIEKRILGKRGLLET